MGCLASLSIAHVKLAAEGGGGVDEVDGCLVGVGVGLGWAYALGVFNPAALPSGEVRLVA